MKTSAEQQVEQALAEIDYLVQGVVARGAIHHEEELDDFALLRHRREYSDLIIGELYEVYFLPPRHEHEWQIIQHAVEAVINSTAAQAIGVGVLSNVLYDAAKRVFARIVEAARKHSRGPGKPAVRSEPYHDIAIAIEKLQAFFSGCSGARIAEIEQHTGLTHSQIYPLVKLLGFRHHRRKQNCLWRPPAE